MAEPPDREARLPLAEEHVAVHKRTVEKGRVRIRTVVEESTRWVTDSLTSEHVQVERVPVEREVEAVPPIRQEGDTTIIPVVDEVLVIERRLVLREELHVRKERRVEKVEEPVTLRTMHAVVEREMRPSGTESTGAENRGDHDVTNTDGAI
ncbi:MAG: YsnF/AvaK domain-containing protein [Steroidobacteraceae bacterium]